jgi:hypothetical protein
MLPRNLGTHGTGVANLGFSGAPFAPAVWYGRARDWISSLSEGCIRGSLQRLRWGWLKGMTGGTQRKVRLLFRMRMGSSYRWIDTAVGIVG